MRLDADWRTLEKKVPLSEAGTFVFEAKTGDLWSFAPEVVLNTIFAPVALEPARAIAMAEVEADLVLHRKFSWLVRKHFERFLTGFAAVGLVIEKDKRGYPTKRSYFTSLKGANRPIIYDTPNRKNVRRDVVKKRGDDRRPWFECEGFGYEVVHLASIWGIRIKPFYMFTKRDGITPLPGYMRTSRATRRIRFDRNPNVESDLTFWARFLSQGAQTVNLGGHHVQDLLLEGGFFTTDVQEGGLFSDSSAENRRSA
jgi:hypothetical protein